MRILGRLEEGQENAKLSRGITHERLDRQTEILSEVAETLRQTQYALNITSEVATQARDEVLKLRTEVDREVKPQLHAVGTFRADAEPVITTIKKLRLSLTVLVWILGAGGVLTTGTFVLANDFAKQLVREWLEINAIREVRIVPDVE